MRRSGIILHPTSLPGRFGIGDMGQEAENFINFLHDTKTTIWQMLPLGPTGHGNSPYTAFSAFAGNELLIAPDILVSEGFLSAEQVLDYPPLSEERVAYDQVKQEKFKLLEKAYDKFISDDSAKIIAFLSYRQGLKQQQQISVEEDFKQFQQLPSVSYWLDDYALFRAIKDEYQDQSWHQWPEAFRDRHPEILADYKEKNKKRIAFYCFCQYIFYRQWYRLRAISQQKQVLLFGDIPIFVAFDSADVWAHKDIFLLNSKGNPKVVAGVPPDYFSSTGQLWGNPLYDWKRLKEKDYDWWVERFRTIRELFDWVRIDHFRGFESYWEVNAREKTAINGHWKKGPGLHLFQTIERKLGKFPIVAEDLGVITPEVEKLRDKMGFPGMKILHFAFGGDANNFYLPHNHIQNSIVYTGTHDNNTTIGWYLEAEAHIKKHVCDYLGIDASAIALQLMRAAFSSVADTAIVPLQDVLELGSESRMNTPAVAAGNWDWRMKWQQLNEVNCYFLTNLNVLTGRDSIVNSEH